MAPAVMAGVVQRPLQTPSKQNGPIESLVLQVWSELLLPEMQAHTLLRALDRRLLMPTSTTHHSLESEAQWEAQAQQVVLAAEPLGQAGVLTTMQTR